MQKYRNVYLIVTDSLGIGHDSRASQWDDVGANTLRSASKTGLLKIPNWFDLGISNIANLVGFETNSNHKAYMAKAESISNAKDTLSGHWEMMGIKTEIPFAIFTDTGFPKELIDLLEKTWNRKIIGNKSASGTTIINELADREKQFGEIIVYTSEDSVLQICANEKWTGLEKLYFFGETAREICNSNPNWKVGRIIVRPYIGENGNYTRTANRKDYSVIPPKDTILDYLVRAKIHTIGIGKISDIFSNKGINQSFKSKNDDHGMEILINLAKAKDEKKKFIFLNLVDFDSKYGHRRDPIGYAKNVNLFDKNLGKLIDVMDDNDILIISSDHGTDPSFEGSKHTREYVPVTIFAKNFKEKPKVLDTFKGFGTIGNLIAKNFDVKLVDTGEDRSFEIK
ncbi:MAG: phosphopentomutase [Mycoplasma sp.]|nr:phosphopentomutase [Mycoplasma sp.]